MSHTAFCHGVLKTVQYNVCTKIKEASLWPEIFQLLEDLTNLKFYLTERYVH